MPEISIATHWHTLQHTAIHCNTLQLTATHCISLQHTRAHTAYPSKVFRGQHRPHDYPRFQLQHTATYCNNTLHNITTHYNTLQLTATHLRIRLVPARFIKVDIVHINARDIHWMKFSKVSVRKFVCVCVYEFVCDIHEPRTIHITSCTWSWEADLYHLPKMKLEKQWLTFSKLYLAALDGPRALAAQESAHSQKVIVNPTP